MLEQSQEKRMQRLILGPMVAAAVVPSTATTFAQVTPQGTPALTPEQRATIRIVVTERLGTEMRDTLPDRLSNAVEAISSLTPEQRAKIRSVIQSRLGDDIKQGLADKLSDRVADRLGNVPIPTATPVSPEQRAAIRAAINERLNEELRDRLADRLADDASKLANLSPEQRALVLAAVRARLADEVRDRIGDRLAEEIGDKLAARSVGSGAK